MLPIPSVYILDSNRNVVDHIAVDDRGSRDGLEALLRKSQADLASADDGVRTALEIKAGALQNMISAGGEASLKRFIDEHVSEAFLRSVTPDALMDGLKRIRWFCAQAGVMIIVPRGSNGRRLTCQAGSTAYAVDFHVASTSPHELMSLEMTKVDSPLPRVESNPSPGQA